MRAFRIAIAVFIFCLAMPFAVMGDDALLTVRGSGSSERDITQIQEIILAMVMGLQRQDPYLVCMYYHPDPQDMKADAGAELESFKATLDRFFKAFSSRTQMNKPYPDMTNTFDFIDQEKDLQFSEDGEAAQLDIKIGCYSLPGDSNVLAELPPEKVNAMSDADKAFKSRFRKTHLNFRKIEGAWYLTSFSGLGSTLDALSAHYQAVETDSMQKSKN
ncbi:hypothetical protein LLH00_14585 [bacterium]|nr:hypothetical protein [bacterium]